MNQFHTQKVIHAQDGLKIKVMVVEVFPIYASGFISILNAQETLLYIAKKIDEKLLLQKLIDNLPDAVCISCESASDVMTINSIQRICLSMKKTIPVFALTDLPRTAIHTPRLNNHVIELPRCSTPETIVSLFHQTMSPESIQKSEGASEAESFPAALLTRREKIVLRAILRGDSQTEIARSLKKSVKTVSTQKLSARRRLGFESDVELYQFLTSKTGKAYLQ